jgi:hypothetical protein
MHMHMRLPLQPFSLGHSSPRRPLVLSGKSAGLTGLVPGECASGVARGGRAAASRCAQRRWPELELRKTTRLGLRRGLALQRRASLRCGLRCGLRLGLRLYLRQELRQELRRRGLRCGLRFGLRLRLRLCLRLCLRHCLRPGRRPGRRPGPAGMGGYGRRWRCRRGWRHARVAAALAGSASALARRGIGRRHLKKPPEQRKRRGALCPRTRHPQAQRRGHKRSEAR